MSVRLALHDDVAVLLFDDGARRNAMTPELGDALQGHVDAVARDSRVRAVVLGGLHGTFSSGGDLRMLERLRHVPAAEAQAFMLGFYRRYLSVLELKVPVIAAVEGAAIGAGLCVAMACDLCVVDEDAKLALNFVQLALHPGMGATYFTPRRVGAQRATELLMTGRRFDGRDAVRWGLALEAVPKDEVLARAMDLARQLAANGPLAVQALKASLGHDRAALERVLEEEARQQAKSYGSADLGEGLKAQAEKRPPKFVGS